MPGVVGLDGKPLTGFQNGGVVLTPTGGRLATGVISPSARALMALSLLLLLAPDARAVRLNAVADTWICEQSPSTAYDNDLISVWATGVEAGGARHGAIMFDLSGFTGQIASAYIELFDRDDRRSRTTALTQQVFILQSTPPEMEGYTWEEYNAFDKPTEAAICRARRLQHSRRRLGEWI